MILTLQKHYKNVRSYLRKTGLMVKGIKFGTKCYVGDYVHMEKSFLYNNKKDIVIGNNVRIMNGCIIRNFGGYVYVGDNSYIGEYAIIYGHGNVVIGNDALIGANSMIISSSHQFMNRAELINSKKD